MRMRSIISRVLARWRGITRDVQRDQATARARDGDLHPDSVAFPRRSFLTNWLADGRRLRPPKRVVADTNPAVTPRTVAQPARRLARVTPDTVPLAHDPGRASTRQAAPELFAPAASYGAKDERLTAELPDSAAADRRLALIRYLVRQGVYNEGFAQRDIPEQYAWQDDVADPPL